LTEEYRQRRTKIKKKSTHKKSSKKVIPNVFSDTMSVLDKPLIEATTQMNRFHEATIDHSSRSIYLNDVNLSVAGKNLLIDSQVRIDSGYRYGLVGRNGVGKSTLLKALGTGLFEGISSCLRILYVEQIEEHLEDMTVLDTVLAADVEAVKLKDRLNILRVASSQENSAGIMALQTIEVEDLIEKVKSKKQIAEKRSGERGIAARSELIKAENELENEVKKSKKQLEEKFKDKVAITIEDKIHAIVDRLQELEIDTAEYRAREILSGRIYF